MKKILKSINNMILTIYTIIYIPIVFMILAILPIMTIADGIKIIQNGYSITEEYVAVMMSISMLVYISLRFKNLRRLYRIFPSLFEISKFLIISNWFICIGVEVLNWSYTVLTPSRQCFGIFAFIFSIIIWRIVIAICYGKKPIVKLMFTEEEKIKNYCEKA